jgi:hypothetical protein
VSLKVLDIARGGLERRGHDEAAFLKSLQLIAESGKTPADALLEVGRGRERGRAAWGRRGQGSQARGAPGSASPGSRLSCSPRPVAHPARAPSPPLPRPSQLYNGRWNKSVDPIFDELAY